LRISFISRESMGGVILLISAILALIWANSAVHDSYHALLGMKLDLDFKYFSFNQDVHFIINDGLMTFFFLIAGMEIRHALHEGALSNWQQAALPLVAACGGVLVPALIFASLNFDDVRLRGWAVPTATDIAFAVGILALLGRAIPANLRIILLSLAIIDDVIAVMIIALFYSSGLDFSGALIALLGVAWVFLWQRLGFASAWFYCLPAALLWFGLWQTGIHPSLAGVILGLVTPPFLVASKNQRYLVAPVIRVPLVLQPWVTFGVMPLFAFANAGVRFTEIDFNFEGTSLIIVGASAGLLLGKPLGVLAASYLAVKLGLCRLPPQLDWAGMALVGLLAGIGFTMAIFVSMLAFDDSHYLAAAKIGILTGSALSALVGLGFGLVYRTRHKIVL